MIGCDLKWFLVSWIRMIWCVLLLIIVESGMVIIGFLVEISNLIWVNIDGLSSRLGLVSLMWIGIVWVWVFRVG